MALILTAVASVLVTLIIGIIIINLSSREKYLEHEIRPCFSVEDPEFSRTLGSLLGPALLPGNRVTALVNGCRYFPDMLEAMRGARETINLETFIYWSGAMGNEFTNVLIERAEAGVKVHLLVDWLGSWKMDRKLLRRIERSQVHLERYRPPNWHNLLTFNNRTHRKLLIVDGRVAYTGGAGIADTWDGDAEDRDHWRDTQYRVEGPVVAQIQSAFLDNWSQTHAELLLGNGYYPPLEPAGPHCAQMFPSGPGEGSESARTMFLLSLACARRSIRMAQAYFVPDKLSVKTLVQAAERGVKIELLLQGPTDAPQTLHAGRWLWKPLLEAGIGIYQYQRAMFHCKTLIVDELWVTLGSANFDVRSFRLNDEANLNVLDADFAREQVEIFEADKAASRRVTLDDYNARPWRMKALDRFWSLFRHQM